MIPEEARGAFESAGWSAGREVPVPEALLAKTGAGHPGVEILKALSGLHVETFEADGTPAFLDFEFRWIDDEPLRDDVASWEQALGMPLVGIADFSHGYERLYVGSDGRCFGLSHIHDAFYFEGASFEGALARLWRDERALPMLRADQASVWLYGIEYTRESPEVYFAAPRPDA